MSDRVIETGYLIVGAGAVGMAFADSLLHETEATMVMADRRHRPGGHGMMPTPSCGCISPRPATGFGRAPSAPARRIGWGGDLSAAVALKAKAEGWLSEIDGVYSQCPYISNAWAEKSPELPSLFENDDYFLNVSMMGAIARAYDPEGVNASNPLAWPLFA